LAYLAVTGETHSREALATLLWPESEPGRSRARLRRELATLNELLGKGWLEVDRDQIGLVRSGDRQVWLDVTAFQELLASRQQHGHPLSEVCPECLQPLREAVALYRGDFLAGFSLPDSPEFDEWQFFQAESLRQALASALERSVRILSSQGEYEAAIPYARRWLALDPLHEPAHRRLMQLYAWAGQWAAALRQYGECEQALKAEFGAPPSAETIALYETIKTKRISAPVGLEGWPDTPQEQGPPLSQHPPDQGQPPSGIPNKVGRYENLTELGQGGFAIAYRAWDTVLKRWVALKVLRSHLLNDRSWLERFQREAQVIARLDHPRIVPIYDLGRAADRLFIVMRLVEGTDLAERIAGQGRLPWPEAVELMSAIAAGLDYAHERGILHRDLKPANILIDPERGPLLSDFGLAKLVGEHSLSQSGDVVGTPHYIAPEIWEGQSATPQGDIYALGCLLYEMLTGEKLFQGESPPAVMAAHFNRLALPEAWPEGVPPGVAQVLKTALARQPANRYTSTGEMAKALASLELPESEDSSNLEVPIQSPKIQNLKSPVRAFPGKIQNPNNLPPQTTLFIGREEELADIRRLLLDEPDCRLLTLVGPGGIGKTRLALAAAAQAIEAFPNDVYFVSLAPISGPEFIVPAIAEALRFTFYGSTDPKDQLLDYLSQKQLLLVVDNFEHLLDGADLLSDILSHAPDVTLLATSRERLNLQEEWSYEVQGMAYPVLENEPAGGPAAKRPALQDYSAVQLFLQRARRVKTRFAPPVEEMVDVVRICQLVDGMPLGLELAAPWIQSLSCREIAAEIEHSLDFLSTTLRNVPERHRSLRVVFEQTWGRLSEAEQAVLMQLSVFRGGCTREAAEQVTGATLPLLSSLVDKALVRRTNTGRYELHELIRQFAEAQLQTDPAAVEQTQQRHQDYFITFLETRTAGIKGHRQKEILAEIKADMDNVRLTWRRAVVNRDAEAIEHTAECLLVYYTYGSGHYEGQVAFQQAVAAFSVLPDPSADDVQPQELIVLDHQENLVGFLLAVQAYFLARTSGRQVLPEQVIAWLLQAKPGDRRKAGVALAFLSWAIHYQGRIADSRPYAELALTLSSETGDPLGEWWSLLNFGSPDVHSQPAKAEQFLKRALAVCQKSGDPSARGFSCQSLAWVSVELGKYREAAQFLDQAIPVFKELGNTQGLGAAFMRAGQLATALGDYSGAIQNFRQALACFDETRSALYVSFCGIWFGIALRLQGNYHQAEQISREALATFKAINDPVHSGYCLLNLGCLAFDQGDLTQAEQLQQEALDMWQQSGQEARVADAARCLGHLIVASGEHRQAEARRYFRQALELSTQHLMAPVALDVCVGVARLRVQAGELEQAVELLTLTEQHEASTFETRQKARQRLAELVDQAPVEVAKIATAPSATVIVTQEQRQARDLWTTVQELLAEINSASS
jgi:serine/threonine protein kinase/DNA-binding SARP family transcriptional activator